MVRVIVSLLVRAVTVSPLTGLRPLVTFALACILWLNPPLVGLTAETDAVSGHTGVLVGVTVRVLVPVRVVVDVRLRVGVSVTALVGVLVIVEVPVLVGRGVGVRV